MENGIVKIPKNTVPDEVLTLAQALHCTPRAIALAFRNDLVLLHEAVADTKKQKQIRTGLKNYRHFGEPC